MTTFPDLRLRRVRELEPVRNLVRETRLSASSFIYPLFVTHGQGVKQPIEPMPGNYQLSLDMLEEEIAEVVNLGIPAVLLFGLPEEKDPVGSGAYDPEGIIQEAITSHQAGRAWPDGGGRRLPLRIHRPRPLRGD